MDNKPPNEEQKLILFACKVRGTIIQFTIEIEKTIEYYIASKFCKDENKIMELILRIIAPHVMLSKKIEIFIQMVKTYNPDFEDKYPGVLGMLSEVNKHRNVFAHWPLDISTESMQLFKQDKGATFVNLKAATTNQSPDPLSVLRHTYNVDAVNQMIASLTKVAESLRTLVSWQTPLPAEM